MHGSLCAIVVCIALSRMSGGQTHPAAAKGQPGGGQFVYKRGHNATTFHLLPQWLIDQIKMQCYGILFWKSTCFLKEQSDSFPYKFISGWLGHLSLRLAMLQRVWLLQVSGMSLSVGVDWGFVTDMASCRSPGTRVHATSPCCKEHHTHYTLFRSVVL